MSLKSITQFVIILLIIVILGGVYFNYFANYSKISIVNNKEVIKPEIESIITEKEIESKITKEKEENNLSKGANENKEVKENKNEIIEVKEEIKPNKPKIDNVVKDIEYITTDKSGNKYKILATSGRTNLENKNKLDLNNVRGVITSEENSPVYILSDFAEYDSSNLKSNFYQNVVINYENKEITCDYFNVDMQTNIAIAYNNVVVTDPHSIMKAGKIILNIKTKIININPDNKKNKVSVKIN